MNSLNKTDAAPQTIRRERRIFEEYAVPAAVAAMALPAIASQIVNVIYNMVDTWFVGLTGDPNAVAALSLCLPVLNLLVAISNLFGVGGASVIARGLGENRPDRARRAFSFAFWGGLIVAMVYALIILLFGRPILMLIGGNAEDIDYAVLYARITITIGGIPAILATTFAHLIRATGASRQASLGLMLGAVLNMAMDPLFMFVLLPPGHEVMGTAISTAVANTISLVYFCVYLARHRQSGVYCIRPFPPRQEDRPGVDVLCSGLPGFTMVLLAMLSNCFLNSMLSSLGSCAIAGVGIVRKIDSMAYAVNQGITQGMIPLVAYCYSSKRYRRMWSVIGFSALCTEGFSLLWSALSVLCAPQMIGVFIRSADTVFYGAQFLRVLTLAIPLYSLVFVVIAVFQGMGRGFQPLLLSVLHKGSADILLMFLLRWKLGVLFIPWSSPIQEGITLILALVLFLRLVQRVRRESQQFSE